MIFNLRKYGFLSFVLVALCMIACEPGVGSVEFEDRLVVFGNLNADQPILDTFYVSLTYAIDESHEEEGNSLADAEVTVATEGVEIRLQPVPGRPGRYLDPELVHMVRPDTEYYLDVQWQDYHVTATTHIPDSITLRSLESRDWECAGESVWIPPIDLHFEENPEALVQTALATGDFSLLTMDTVTYREGQCYTSSFASVPMFIVEWTSETEPGLIRAVTLALEDSYDNAIVDTSFSAHAFKGHMNISEDGQYYWPNPMVWNLSQEKLDFGWLSFNYYGVNMVIIQGTDHGFRDYLAGNPFRQNQYLLPNSNIEGGFGLFSSSYSRYFFVYIKPEDN